MGGPRRSSREFGFHGSSLPNSLVVYASFGYLPGGLFLNLKSMIQTMKTLLSIVTGCGA